MINFAKITLDEEIIRMVIGYCFFIASILFIIFLKIIMIDEICFKNNLYTKHFTFKHRMFFIFQFDKKHKNIVSRRTFILEIIWYLLIFINIISCICSLFMNFTTAVIVLVINATITISFAMVTSTIHTKEFRKVNLPKDE